MTVKAYLILGAVLVALLGEGMLCWKVYRDGEAKVQAADTAAAARQRKLDDSLSQTTVDALKADNARLANSLSQPALHVLCVPQIHYVRTGGAAGSAQPAVAAPAGTGPSSVPSGTADVDLGPALQDLALSAAILADYRQRTWQWAVTQGK